MGAAVTVLPVAEYMPDAPSFPATGSNAIVNVLPRTALSYGPFPSLTQYSTALTARCQGAYAMQDSGGNVRIFAGDATKLYRISGSATFSDVSKVGGYTTNAVEKWSMALFGSRVVATNYADAPQSYIEGSSALFADMIATGITSLKARHVAVVRDFLMFGNTSDGTFGVRPQRVWWSAIDDPTNFPTPGTSGAAAVQSDYQDVVGDHGACQGIVGNLGTASAAVFFERAVFRMDYAGPPTIFAITAAQGAQGTPAPGSIVHYNNMVFYLGQDGFYVFDGTSSQPIGKNKIDKTFFQDLNQSYLERITGAVDPINSIVFWAYPGVQSGAPGDPNRIIAYNWSLGRWSITEANALVIEYLLRSLSVGQSPDSIATSPDTWEFSPDSRSLTGGKLLLAGFDTTHKLSYFTGQSLAATIETQDLQPFDTKRAMVTQVRPLVESSAATLAIGHRDRLSETVVYDTAVGQTADGTCPVRSSGRYLRAKVVIPAGADWTHASGVDVEAVTAFGKR